MKILLLINKPPGTAFNEAKKMQKLPEHLQKFIDELEANPEKKAAFEKAINKKVKRAEFIIEEIDCSEIFNNSKKKDE